MPLYFLNESKTRRKNLVIGWIDNKKAYNMVPQCWIMYCLKMYKISDELIENKNGKKNSCMDVSSDKRATSHSRKLGRG